jgi:hypothetical protein
LSTRYFFWGVQGTPFILAFLQQVLLKLQTFNPLQFQRHLEFPEPCHQLHDPRIVLFLLRGGLFLLHPQMFNHLILRCQHFIRTRLNDSGLLFHQLFLLLRHHTDVHLVLRHDVELTVAVVLILGEG